MSYKKIIETEKHQTLANLESILRFPSISAQSKHKHDILACKDWLMAYCKEIGFPLVECLETAGHPAVFASWEIAPDLPTLLIYGHYDVQPPEPFDLWHSPPFEPLVKEGYIYARGCSDNKGQFMAHLEAIRLFAKSQGKPPINIKCLIEGEEEIGSENLGPVLEQYKNKLKADLCVVSDNPMYDKKTPSVCLSLRGIACSEISLKLAETDLHSGQFGGCAPNACLLLSQLLAQLHSKDNLVAIPGFYEGIPVLSETIKDQMDALNLKAAQVQADMKSPLYIQAANHQPFEQLWYLPTLDCNGIWGGYTGEGSKTIVPCEAHAKLSMRLVGSQDPIEMQAKLDAFLQQQCPKEANLTIKHEHGASAYQIPFNHPAIPLAQEALTKSFSVPAVLQGEGGSIPILNLFKSILGIDSILMGLNHNDDCIHAPNERFLLSNYYGGINASMQFCDLLSKKKQ